jgi:hypothetical protein
MLQEATAGYLQALAAGSPTFPSLMIGNVSYEENDVVMDISKGVLSQGIKIDFNRSIYDIFQCVSYTEVVATTKHPYVIGARLSFTGDKVTMIETNVCDDGDWSFNATASLFYNKREKWDPIATADQDTRQAIQAAADAYLNEWGNNSIKPPFASNCARLEGGAYVTNGCSMYFMTPFNVTHRRYTIDEELGAVNIFHNFPWLDASLPKDPGTPTNNFFRIEAGKIHYIHENTVCSKRNCSR